MSQKSLKKNALLNIIRSVSSIIFPLITFPYASRILLPEGIGKVNFANSIISYFSIIAGLGIGTYATREAAKRRDNRDELSKFVKEITVIHIFSTIISYALFLVAFFLVPKFQNYKSLLLLSSLTIILSTIDVGWLYSAEEEFEYTTFRTVLFQIIGLIILFMFVKTKDDYLQYMFLNVFCSAGSNILNFCHSRKYISWKKHFNLQIKKHLKPIFLFFSMSLVSSVYTLLDTSMLGFISNNSEVGYYSAATKLVKIVLTLITALTEVLLPRLSYYYQTGKKKELLDLFNKSFSYTTILSIPCMTGLILLSKPLILLLSGESYLPAVFPMRIITPILFFISLSNLIGIQLFAPIGKEKITFQSVIIGAIVNFSLNSFLIPKYNAIGAAIATIIAETSVTIYQIIRARKYIYIKKQIISILKSIVSCIVMSVGVLAICYFIKNILLQVCLSIIAGVIIYALMIILLKNEVAIELLKNLKAKVFDKKVYDEI